MSTQRTRVPVAFKIVSFEEMTHHLPDGRELTQPKHFRLLGPDGDIVASGPYKHEGTMALLLRCAGEFMREHPQRARELMAATHHTHVQVPLTLLKDDSGPNDSRND